ncbi:MULTISPECIES: co-chaperone DjlA [unclassified Gilliamella]|uniref:co-chaperone DjlA n=1 Tax=unclassified Gilliamella TaxID=2685620 RepID=UPI00226AB22C|nr:MULTISPECIES: co-chaperone DjlA [unclassified Gilliamella]MCX8596575.1 co-chaperone DjlA [Gilliamella sp. B3493]MCX8600207.1 co-chaperone DjlA [Gilliamella sp. B3486]MCX8690483.1 co-chaperone DjlA [Gilliamella sp. B2973]MCX8706182.1 co-chaperone DjlA [Gilliamella sp. B3127]
MSFIWSIIFGLILSSVFKSGWGFILGLLIGPMLYQAFGNRLNEKRTQSNPTLYLIVAFEVLGHLSKAKGVVTQDDINLARQFMDRLQLDAAGRQLAQESFNRGKASDYPLRSRLRELYFQYRFRRNVLNIFCEQLIQAALVDGNLDEKESQILFIVAEEFHIPRQQMVIYIQMMMGSFHFRQEYHNNQQNSQYQQSNNYGNYQNSSHQSDLQNAYRILGIDSSADIPEIKKAYRRLMNEHHPDKLASKGLPKEMLEATKKRAQEIQAAYDLIKASRGFK